MLPHPPNLHHRLTSFFLQLIALLLSSDNPVPAPYSKFYNREEQGEILDYVIIMGYDEHHSRSETSGSVASINFIKEALDNLIY